MVEVEFVWSYLWGTEETFSRLTILNCISFWTLSVGVLFLCNMKQAVPEVCQVSRGARARDRAWVCQVWKHKVVTIYLHRLHWGDFKCTGFTASKVFFSVHLLLKRHMWLIINRAIPPTRGPLQSGFGSFLIPVNSTAHGGSVTRGVGWGKVLLSINNNALRLFHETRVQSSF